MNKQKVLEIAEICENNSISYNIYTEETIIAKQLKYNVLYYYKEKLIDKYEDLVFTLKEDYVGEFIKTNIHEFDFDKNCKAKYINGTILLIVGEGKGSLIEGKLRINSCDDSVIREKIYLLDIFK